MDNSAILYIFNHSNQTITIGVSPAVGSSVFSGSGQIPIQPSTTFTIESDRINLGQLRNLVLLGIVTYTEGEAVSYQGATGIQGVTGIGGGGSGGTGLQGETGIQGIQGIQGITGIPAFPGAAAYGEMTLNNPSGGITGVMMTNQNQYYQITNGWVAGDNSGVSFNTDELVVNTAGTYLTICTLSVEVDTPNQDIVFGIFKNGSIITDHIAQVRMDNASETSSVTVTGVVTGINSGDTFDIRVQDITEPGRLLTILYSNFNLEAISGAQGETGIQGLQGITGIGSQGIQGVTGSQGLTGIQGLQGITGWQGNEGNPGQQGVTGIQGVTGAGIQGATGIGSQGIQGLTGIQGVTGAGIQGVTGFIGVTGFQGLTGSQGVTGFGIQGATGLQGAGGLGMTGVQGATGAGIQGATGFIGVTGIQGVTGLLGMTGAGAPGVTGLIGSTGIQGLTGIQGVTGFGLQGVTGLQGIQGATGSGGGGGGGSSTEFNNISRYEAVSTSGQTVWISSSSTVLTGLTWSRSGTTLTITSSGHGRSNGDVVIVRNASQDNFAAAVTVIDGNNFSVTCSNSGGTSGSAAAYSLGFTYAHNSSTPGQITSGTLTAPGGGDVVLIGLHIYLAASQRQTTTYDVILPQSATNGAGLNDSVNDLNVPVVVVRQMNNGTSTVMTSVGFSLANALGGSNYNDFQLAALGATTTPLSIHLSF